MDGSTSGAAATASAPSSTDAGTPNQDSAQADIPQVKKYKVKVDGEEREVSEDDLLRDYQLQQASRKRFTEADQRAKEADAKERKANAVLEALSKGDLDFVKKNVPKDVFKKLSTDFLLEELEWENLPDHEKRRIVAERRAEEAESKLSEREKGEKEAKAKIEYEASLQEAHKNLDRGFSEAIKGYKDVGVYIDHSHMHRALQILEASIKAKKSMTPSDALSMAVKEDSDAYGQRMKALGLDDLIKTLPKEKLDELRRHFVKQAQGKLQDTSKKEPEIIRRSAKDKVGLDDWFKNLDKRYT